MAQMKKTGTLGIEAGEENTPVCSLRKFDLNLSSDTTGSRRVSISETDETHLVLVIALVLELCPEMVVYH